MRDNSSCLTETVCDFDKKKWIKVQNCRLSTAHLYFQQVCTMIGSFCGKYIKFQLEKYRGVILMTLKSDTKFENKLGLLFEK